MSDNEIKRTSRNSELKSKEKRRAPWVQPSNLDAPPAPNGFKHRWLRAESAGFQDTANMSKKLREGYELVRAEELTAQIGKHDFPVISEGRHAGFIGVGGLVLARIPEEIVEQRNAYFRKRSSEQIQAVDNDLMKEQRPEMPININRQSRVTFGGGRKK
jgi:hypothetical protein